MPHIRSWVAPPTRRELTLLIFSLTIFILSYNLETSLRMVGVKPPKAGSSPYLSAIGLGSNDPGLERDGRRPLPYRDELERLITGNWDWRENDIAATDSTRGSFIQTVRGLKGEEAEGREHVVIYKAPGVNTAMRSAVGKMGKDALGVGIEKGKGVTVKEQMLKWGDNVPPTKVVAHVPGYTILENLLMLNGTLYIVTDNPSHFPELPSIGSSVADPSAAPQKQDWNIMTPSDARTTLGFYGGRLRDTTWLASEPSEYQDPYTIFSLFRTHSYMLSPQDGSYHHSSSGLRIIQPGSLGGLVGIPPPVRLIFKSIPTFSSPGLLPLSGDPKEHPPRRTRSYMGVHNTYMKALFPTTGVLYQEDWNDLAEMHIPFLFDRVVIADSGAAERGRSIWTNPWTSPAGSTEVKNPGGELRRRADGEEGDQEGKPTWAAPFVGFDVVEGWWKPVRDALLAYLRLPSDAEAAALAVTTKKKHKSKRGPVLTYVSMELVPPGGGSRLTTETHLAIVQGLRQLLHEGVLGEAHVVQGNGTGEVWEERMKAIARSHIIIGPFGPQLADSLFMRAPLPSETEPPSSDPNVQQSIPPFSPVLMEFFPDGMFRRDQQYAVHQLGMRYVAWLGKQKYSGNSLPPVMGLPTARNANIEDLEFSIDTDELVNTIRGESLRFKNAP